jgi:limonene-1,2-epoxide hydrolase
MSAKALVEQYFNTLKSAGDFAHYFSESIAFTSFTSPVRKISGREEVVKATQRFYSSVQSFELRNLLAEHDAVCALTRYQLRAPSGAIFSSDVAEIFEVRAGEIDAFSIYFDSAPFQK